MKAFVDAIIMRYKNSSLQSKLFLSYFILIFIPIIILSWFSLEKSGKVIKQQSLSIAQSYLSQTQSLLKNSMIRMSECSLMLSQRADIQDVLKKRNLSFSEEYDVMDEFFKTVTTVKSLYDVYRVRIYIDESFFFHKSNYITYGISDIVDEEWYRAFENSLLFQTILPPHEFSFPILQTEQLISIATPVRSPENINEILGVVLVDMPVTELKAQLKTADYTSEARVFLVNSKDEFIYGISEAAVESDIKALLAEAKLKLPDANTSGTINVGTQVLGLSEPVYGDWRIFTVSSYDKLLEQSNLLKRQLIILAFVVGIIVYLLAYFYARYNTKRVKALSEQVKKVESGDFNVKCIVDSEDEIGELQNSFNFMVRKISSLLDERYRIGKNLKGMELKALQAQINPHFLYNTLDLISWKAKAAGNDEIVNIVWQLAQFYRISLSNGSDFIPIADELEHVRLYVELQNQRINSELPILIMINAQEEATKLPIMKLILQPIVENSVLHGLLADDKRQGEISITVSRIEEQVIITVCDNGVGMNKSRLNSLTALEKLGSSSSSGYGISNIRERLRLYYDNNFCFDVSSTPDVGTTVTIKIPVEQNAAPRIHIERKMKNRE